MNTIILLVDTAFFAAVYMFVGAIVCGVPAIFVYAFKIQGTAHSQVRLERMNAKAFNFVKLLFYFAVWLHLLGAILRSI